MLRNSADWRSLLWAALMPVVLIAQLANPKLLPYLAPLSFYFAVAAGTMAHNHNHTPIFKNRRLNGIYSTWVSLFYGYPTFAWVPTHNLNHHKHVNREGDATITWRHTNKNVWYIAISYFFVSSYFQSGPIKEYIAKAKRSNPALHKHIVKQYVTWGAFLTVTFAAAMYLHGWNIGLKTWMLTVGGPTFLGTWSMMWFNYMQHVHCDVWSEHNHSRNITGRVFNFLLFNNGLHTIHHENPGSHWSKAYELHAKLEPKMDPRVNEWSFCWFVFRVYVLGAFFSRFQTEQIGRAPWDVPEGVKSGFRSGDRILTDSVDALDAGENAQMVSAAG